MWVSWGTRTRHAPWEGTHDMGVAGTPKTQCTAGGHPGPGCHGDPGDAVHCRWAPRTWVSWGPRRRGAPWEAPLGTRASRAARHAMHHGTPGRHAGRWERRRCWARRRHWTPLSPGEGVGGGGGCHPNRMSLWERVTRSVSPLPSVPDCFIAQGRRRKAGRRGASRQGRHKGAGAGPRAGRVLGTGCGGAARCGDGGDNAITPTASAGTGCPHAKRTPKARV